MEPKIENLNGHLDQCLRKLSCQLSQPDINSTTIELSLESLNLDYIGSQVRPQSD